jgi:hypothetical protein
MDEDKDINSHYMETFIIPILIISICQSTESCGRIKKSLATSDFSTDVSKIGVVLQTAMKRTFCKNSLLEVFW